MNKKIKEEFEHYEIKTKSNDILSKISEKKKTSYLIPSLSMGFVAIVIVVVMMLTVFGNSDNKKIYIKNEPVLLTDSSVLSRTSLEVCYTGMFLNADNKSMLLSNANQSEAITKYSEIEEIIENFYLKNNIGLISYYESTNFEYIGNKYLYKLTVDDYILYSKDNINIDKYEGEILLMINNEYYNGEIEIKTKLDEAEVSITYYKDDLLITIETENESDEFSIEHTIKNKTNKEILLENKLSIEIEDDELELKYEHMTIDTDYSFKVIDNKDGTKNIVYKNNIDDFKVEMIYNPQTKEFIFKKS